MQFITDLLRKLGVGVAEVSAEDFEDAGLLKLMQQADLTETVNRDEIFRKLGES